VPDLPLEAVPNHVAVVMDGNGRWARQRGLPRTEGHRAGEEALVEVVAGAIEAKVRWLSVYAFSTENWKRSPSEVRFLMGYSRRVLRQRRDLFNSWNVRIGWAGQRQRLWPSVIKELDDAAHLTRGNTGLNLTLCVNYGGRDDIVAAARAVLGEAARQFSPASGKSQTRGASPGDAAALVETMMASLTEDSISQRVATPDVDLFWRTSGEQRLSNFLIWQAAYAELVFSDKLWPDVDRRDLWDGIVQYSSRQRRYGA
jgi:undecaprenyl diphosphate synthase